jgi:sulfate adenylyltransferase subunit 2
MNHLDNLESRSVYVLREVFRRIDRPAILWPIGQDSSVLMWLTHRAFFWARPVAGGSRRHHQQIA